MSAQSLRELQDVVVRVSDLYAQRCDITRDKDWYALKLGEELGELNAEYLRLSGRGRKKGQTDVEIRANLGRECADVFAHLMLFAHDNGIDLEQELKDKWFKQLEKSDV